MKSFRSTKSKKLKRTSVHPLAILVAAGSLTGLLALLTVQITHFNQPGQSSLIAKSKDKKPSSSKDVLSSSTSPKGSRMPPMILPPPPPPALTFNHLGIVTTLFWVGEKAGGDNGFIANSDSTWDGQWLENFGGADDPSHRNGYLPNAFTPKENPFYVALPYSDITDSGNRKSSASNCPLHPSLKQQLYSWCKNSWVAIRHRGKVVYAQWEDAGPFGEDDLSYVFGKSKPANQDGEKAGLDVSPAIRDYLSLKDVDSCDWAFISAGSVPSGPWKQIVTTTTGETVN